MGLASRVSLHALRVGKRLIDLGCFALLDKTAARKTVCGDGQDCREDHGASTERDENAVAQANSTRQQCSSCVANDSAGSCAPVAGRSRCWGCSEVTTAGDSRARGLSLRVLVRLGLLQLSSADGECERRPTVHHQNIRDPKPCRAILLG